MPEKCDIEAPENVLLYTHKAGTRPLCGREEQYAETLQTLKEKGMKEMYVKGVNLGNWLVLEKWMSPGLFDGTTAEDEYYLPTQLPKEIYEERIRMHRSEYITERRSSDV